MTKNFVRFILPLSVLLIISGVAAFAEKSRRSHEHEAVLPQDTELIDTPTAGVVDYYGLQLRTRFYSGGGLMTGAAFGVLPRLNLGVNLSLENLIGTDTNVRLVRPEIQAKYRFYDGSSVFPALAIGYDGQGYYYDHEQKKYMEKGKGLYLAASREVIFPGLFFHPGVNVSDFDNSSVFLFFGLNYVIEDSFSLMAEWDNVQRVDESRFNVGGRFYVTPFFQIDAAVREIGKNTTFSNGQKNLAERIVQLRYVTSF
ncbi:MAG: hypothetical protein WCS77_09280 [Elusimicrobiaceae bacterium]